MGGPEEGDSPSAEEKPELGCVWMDERRGASGPEALEADWEFGLQTSKGDPQMDRQAVGVGSAGVG